MFLLARPNPVASKDSASRICGLVEASWNGGTRLLAMWNAVRLRHDCDVQEVRVYGQKHGNSQGNQGGRQGFAAQECPSSDRCFCFFRSDGHEFFAESDST
jgi:hypothetical protein